MQIIYTAEFIRLFKKLPLEIKKEAVKKELIFKKNPFDMKLKTHKLGGKLKNCYAFSISYSNRVIFEFDKNEVVYFHSIGTHSIYK
ncbi:MAG: Plasmid stabilization system [Parcubacteria group bacterium GW2011_GWF2_38_8]|nr:MAG: Plasmid stabilization system [Parcubacteria group bacterium GW2011_GWF2_38_8]